MAFSKDKNFKGKGEVSEEPGLTMSESVMFPGKNGPYI
jgi:hypothetical protein